MRSLPGTPIPLAQRPTTGPRVVPPSSRHGRAEPTQGLRSPRLGAPLSGAGDYDPPAAAFGEEPAVGTTVGDRYVVREKIGRMGGGLLARALDLDVGTPVLVLVAPADQAPQLPTRRDELTVPRAPRSSRLATPQELGDWGGLRFCVFPHDQAVGLDELLNQAGGTLPPLHLSLLAAQGCVGLGALHTAGWLLGGVWGASARVDPWSMELKLLGWGIPSPAGPEFERRARAELRGLGRLLMGAGLKRWGVGSELKRLSPERDLMDLLGLLSSTEESTFLPGATDLAAAFGSVASTLR